MLGFPPPSELHYIANFIGCGVEEQRRNQKRIQREVQCCVKNEQGENISRCSIGWIAGTVQVDYTWYAYWYAFQATLFIEVMVAEA